SAHASGVSARPGRWRIASIVRISLSRFEGWVGSPGPPRAPRMVIPHRDGRRHRAASPGSARLVAQEGLDLLAVGAEAVEHALADHDGRDAEPSRPREEIQARLPRL